MKTGKLIKKFRARFGTYYMCPSCGEFITKDNYCSKCGQKLQEEEKKK